MPWTERARRDHSRKYLRYPSDLLDREWEGLRRLFPRPHRRGRPRLADFREVLNAILYLLASGCPWRMLPREFPPRSTVQRYFYRWRDTGLWRRIARLLVRRERRRLGRTAQPSAGIVDSQSIRTGEGGEDRGFDAAKRVKGRKRHIVVDTLGNLLDVQVHAGNIQDNHGAVPLINAVGTDIPNLRHLFADRVYRGPKLLGAVAETGPWTIEIITRSQSVGTFRAEPKRWVVERTFAWIIRNRRLAADYERLTSTAEAWVWIAAIKRTIRKLNK
jgi:putative transposase